MLQEYKYKEAINSFYCFILNFRRIEFGRANGNSCSDQIEICIIERQKVQAHLEP